MYHFGLSAFCYLIPIPAYIMFNKFLTKYIMYAELYVKVRYYKSASQTERIPNGIIINYRDNCDKYSVILPFDRKLIRSQSGNQIIMGTKSITPQPGIPILVTSDSLGVEIGLVTGNGENVKL